MKPILHSMQYVTAEKGGGGGCTFDSGPIINENRFIQLAHTATCLPHELFLPVSPGVHQTVDKRHTTGEALKHKVEGDVRE